MNRTAAETLPEKNNSPVVNIPGWVVKAFGDLSIAGAAIADEQGNLPQPATDRESFLRPESSKVWLFGPERFSVNATESLAQSVRAARDKALKSDKPLEIGNHTSAVAGTVQALAAFNAKSFNTRHGNRNPQRAKTKEERADLQKTIAALDWTAYRPSGYKSYGMRRRIDKLLIGKQRKPEEQVEAERITALRTIGQITNFEARLREIIAVDETGETEALLVAHQPVLLKKRLGELVAVGKIDESSPFHPRWSEQQDPMNVQSLRRYMIVTSNKDRTGEEPRNMATHIEASGINGSVRPRVVSRYLGITKEQWDAQRYGQDYSGPGKIPAEVLDQINFFIKLDSRIVDYTESPEGRKTAITALDIFIKYGAGKPWTETPKDSGHRTPMERIKDGEPDLRQAEQDDMTEYYAGPILDQLSEIELRLQELPEDSIMTARLRKRRNGLRRELNKLGINNTNGSIRQEAQPDRSNTANTIKINIDDLLPVSESFLQAAQNLPQEFETDMYVLGLLHIIDKLQTTLEGKEGSVGIDEILPIVDDFDLALKSILKAPETSKGLKEMLDIITRLQDVLEANGAERLEVIGKEFDPKYHEAVEVERGVGEKQMVSDEIRAGYIHGDHIIRPALVKVSLQ